MRRSTYGARGNVEMGMDENKVSGHLFFHFVNKRNNISNKRAKRALGRSPEKKVKGHSGAIYRGPLM